MTDRRTVDLLRDPDTLDRIARYLVREQSNGLCVENYPNPCSMCDCFDGSTIRYAQAQAAGIVALLVDRVVADA
jgi:hypothetical protein